MLGRTIRRFALIPTKVQWRMWSLPSKLTCIGAYLGVLAIILTVIFYVWPMSSEPPKTTMTQSVSKVARDAYNFQGSQVTIVQQHDAKEVLPLKDRIRSYLRTVNPKTVELLDSGQHSVAVMINTANQPALFELQKDPDFGAYLEVRSTGSVSAGSHNIIGGHLNDLQDTGMLNGFEFVFKDRLRL